MPTIYDNPMFQLQPQGGAIPQASVNTFGPQGAFGPATTGSGTPAPITNMEDQGAGGSNTNLASGSFAPAATPSFTSPTNTFGPQGAFGAPATGSGYGYISPRDKVASGMMNYGYRRFAPHGMFGGI